jgi:hypothetical protein
MLTLSKIAHGQDMYDTEKDDRKSAATVDPHMKAMYEHTLLRVFADAHASVAAAGSLQHFLHNKTALWLKSSFEQVEPNDHGECSDGPWTHAFRNGLCAKTCQAFALALGRFQARHSTLQQMPFGIVSGPVLHGLFTSPCWANDRMTKLTGRSLRDIQRHMCTPALLIKFFANDICCIGVVCLHLLRRERHWQHRLTVSCVQADGTVVAIPTLVSFIIDYGPYGSPLWMTCFFSELPENIHVQSRSILPPDFENILQQ